MLEFIQIVTMIIVPALIFAYKTHEGTLNRLDLNKRVSFTEIIMASLAIIVSIPFNSLLYEINISISFPEFMSPLEDWFWQRHNDDTIKKILLYDTPLNLIISLFIVGVLAAFSEELFFRGSLQKILYGESPLTPKKAYTSIIIASLIFSAFHIDFFCFIPRFVIGGVFFGLLYYWSGSLWLTIWSHFFYNTTYFLSSVYFEKYTDKYKDIENIVFPFYIYIISTLLFGAIIYWFYKKRRVSIIN